MYIHCGCLQTLEKRKSDLVMDGCEPSCGCWDLNSVSLEEQSVLLTTKPSLQPSKNFKGFTNLNFYIKTSHVFLNSSECIWINQQFLINFIMKLRVKMGTRNQLSTIQTLWESCQPELPLFLFSDYNRSLG